MKNSLENLVIFLFLFLLFMAGPFFSVITGIRFPSLFSLGSPAINYFFPEGGLEGFATIFPIGIAYIALMISFVVYLIGFMRNGLVSQKGMAKKIKYFLPWLFYILGLGLIPYFLFLTYVGFSEDLVLVPLPICFAIIWFFITREIGKRINKKYG